MDNPHAILNNKCVLFLLYRYAVYPIVYYNESDSEPKKSKIRLKFDKSHPSTTLSACIRHAAMHARLFKEKNQKQDPHHWEHWALRGPNLAVFGPVWTPLRNRKNWRIFMRRATPPGWFGMVRREI